MFSMNDLRDPSTAQSSHRVLHNYITNLPELEVDWDLQLQSDFNEVCQREIFTEDFDPEKVDIMRGVYKETEARLDAEDEIRHKEYEEMKKKEQEIEKARQRDKFKIELELKANNPDLV